MLERLRPSDGEIRELAFRETDPQQASRFEPVTRGPVFAVLALLAIGIAALPACLVRLLRRSRKTAE